MLGADQARLATGAARTKSIEGWSTIDDPSFSTFYANTYRDTHRYVLSLTRSTADAEDIVAEAYERAYRAWADSRVAEEKRLPWILRIARNVATDRWRRAQKLRRVLAMRTRAVPSDDQAHLEFWLWFDALSYVLSTREREALVLRYRFDLKEDEIGSVLGMSASGVRKAIARALDNLRSHPELLR